VQHLLVEISIGYCGYFEGLIVRIQAVEAAVELQLGDEQSNFPLLFHKVRVVGFRVFSIDLRSAEGGSVLTEAMVLHLLYPLPEPLPLLPVLLGHVLL